MSLILHTFALEIQMKNSMDKNSRTKQEVIEILQDKAARFLTESRLEVNGLVIFPTEIEVYYYSEDFKDTSVHQNELQTKKGKNHFYVHRKGKKQTDKYIGGSRGGLDFVISDNDDIYYSYLIRSAVVGDSPVVGPNKVLNSIMAKIGLDEKMLEDENVEIRPNNKIKCKCEVLFSRRINLGENAKEFAECELRAVLLDEWFKCSGYRNKQELIISKIRRCNMLKEDALLYAKEMLGYVPDSIRTL